MDWFVVEFTDGKEISVEADAHELHDGEWLFRRGDDLVARYGAQHVRGIQKLPPGALQTQGGGSY
jgi:hypothetical protein